MPSPVGAWPRPMVAVPTDQGASLLDANQQGETPVLRELADKTPGDSGFLSSCLEMMGPCGGWKMRWGSKQMHRQGRRVSGASLERVHKDQATNCYCEALTCFEPSSFLLLPFLHCYFPAPALPSLLLCWGYFFPWESPLKVLFKLHLLFMQQVFLEQFLCAQMMLVAVPHGLY